MAYITSTRTAPRGNILTSFVDGLARGFTKILENNARVHEYERLQALSDEALARRGLKREDIARHVFKDLFYV